MKAVFVTIAILGAAVALSGQPSPKPADAAPVVVQDTAAIDALKAEIETLRAELAQAKSVPIERTIVQPVSVSAPARAVCANGSCGVASAPRRVFIQRPQRSGWYPGKLLRGRRL